MLSRIKVLETEDLARIHEASLKALEEIGMVFHQRKAIELLKEHGAKVNGKTVYIPRSLVERSLALCPKTFKWRARNRERSIVVGEGLHFQASGGSTYIQDIERGRRPSKLEDFVNIQKLYQSSKVIDIVGFSPVDAGDIEPKFRHLYMQQEILKHTDKPVHGHVCGGPGAAQMLEMIKIAFGEDELFEHNHVIGLSINTLSPLGFGEDQLDTLVEYVRRNQIIIACPMAIGGVSAPMSHVGITVLVNAEILAMITLIQLLNPGNPVIIAPSSSFADMRTGAYSAGIPDGILHIITQIELSRELYGLPTRVLGGACDAKALDAQAGYETMQNILFSALAGADIIAHACGVLDGLMTISYEKMMIDEELLQRAAYFRMRPVDLSDQALALNVIKEVGPGGSYFSHQSVFEQCRDFFKPDVSDWQNYAEWQRNGSQDIALKANRIFKERLASAPGYVLDQEAQKMVDDYVKKVVES